MAPLPEIRSEPRLRPHLRAGVPALVAVALMLVWAIQNGGFDASTWYWGALVLLATFTAVFAGRAPRPPEPLAGQRDRRRPVRRLRGLVLPLDDVGPVPGHRAGRHQPGPALPAHLHPPHGPAVDQGDRARRASPVRGRRRGSSAWCSWCGSPPASNVPALFFAGAASSLPTGYINSTAALFTMDALVSIVLASRRRLPGPLRGLLMPSPPSRCSWPRSSRAAAGCSPCPSSPWWRS